MIRVFADQKGKITARAEVEALKKTLRLSDKNTTFKQAHSSFVIDDVVWMKEDIHVVRRPHSPSSPPTCPLPSSQLFSQFPNAKISSLLL